MKGCLKEVNKIVKENKNVFVLSQFENLDNMIDEAQNFGYDIKLIHLNTTMENSIERCIKRSKARGREVDIESIKQRKYIDEIVNNYKNNKNLSEIIIYDNNGNSPELIEHILIK